MLYRIRYRSPGLCETQTQVEANSPNEAMVKFRCTADAGGGSITSVCGDQPDEAVTPESAWS